MSPNAPVKTKTPPKETRKLFSGIAKVRKNPEPVKSNAQICRPPG